MFMYHYEAKNSLVEASNAHSMHSGPIFNPQKGLQRPHISGANKAKDMAKAKVKAKVKAKTNAKVKANAIIKG